MHIPDGFIDGKTAATAAALSAAGVGFALRQVRRELPPRKVPLLGLAAAFLFAAQMVNFPVPGGTSGHLLGGVLVSALLGPSAAVVVVTTVLIVQCFLFGDGGVSALGANIFNMAILGSVSGYAIYRLTARGLPGPRGRVLALAFAGWCSAVLASICCAGQLAWSGTLTWAVAFPAMAGIHALIGVGEGLISALVLLAVERTRPDLIPESGVPAGPARARELLGFGLLATLGVAVFIVPFACPWPDGLESVAAKLGFAHSASAPFLPALMPDYHLPGIGWDIGATALAGAIGSLVVFGLALLLGRVLVPDRAGESRPGLSILGHHHRGHRSAIHRLSAQAKLGTGLVLIVAAALMPLAWTGWFAGVAALLIAAAGLSRIPPMFLLKRLLVLSPFVLGVALVNAFEPAARGNWLGLAIRSVLCLFTVILVSNTTPFNEVLRALQRARVPRLLITTIMLMHRYLFVLVDEAERMRRARSSRTFVRQHRFHWQTLATVIGQLFIRASERAERIFDAMRARGWK